MLINNPKLGHRHSFLSSKPRCSSACQFLLEGSTDTSNLIFQKSNSLSFSLNLFCFPCLFEWCYLLSNHPNLKSGSHFRLLFFFLSHIQLVIRSCLPLPAITLSTFLPFFFSSVDYLLTSGNSKLLRLSQVELTTLSFMYPFEMESVPNMCCTSYPSPLLDSRFPVCRHLVLLFSLFLGVSPSQPSVHMY